MNGKQHFLFFSFVWLGLLVWRIIIKDINWYLMSALWFGFLVSNPDIDLILSKIFKKQLHRWFLTHSMIYPSLLYLSIRYYLNMETAKEFGFILFLPTLLHLVSDFQIKEIMDKDKKDTAGTWQISLYPLRKKRLNPHQTILWMLLNVIIVSWYTYWIYI
jgi:hypothetical protein